MVVGETVVTTNELRSWVLQHAYPAVVGFSEDNMDLMFSDKRPGFQNHVLLFVDKSSAVATSLLAAFHEKAVLFNGVCIFIVVDLSKSSVNEFTQNLLSDLSVSSEESPRVMIIKSARTKIEFYDMERDSEGVTGEGIEDFVRQFFASSIRPTRVINVPK